jgi:hypothetical protein
MSGEVSGAMGGAVSGEQLRNSKIAWDAIDNLRVMTKRLGNPAGCGLRIDKTFLEKFPMSGKHQMTSSAMVSLVL